MLHSSGKNKPKDVYHWTLQLKHYPKAPSRLIYVVLKKAQRVHYNVWIATTLKNISNICAAETARVEEGALSAYGKMAARGFTWGHLLHSCKYYFNLLVKNQQCFTAWHKHLGSSFLYL